jgi:hypothetical protein
VNRDMFHACSLEWVSKYTSNAEKITYTNAAAQRAQSELFFHLLLN